MAGHGARVDQAENKKIDSHRMSTRQYKTPHSALIGPTCSHAHGGVWNQEESAHALRSLRRWPYETRDGEDVCDGAIWTRWGVRSAYRYVFPLRVSLLVGITLCAAGPAFSCAYGWGEDVDRELTVACIETPRSHRASTRRCKTPHSAWIGPHACAHTAVNGMEKSAHAHRVAFGDGTARGDGEEACDGAIWGRSEYQLTGTCFRSKPLDWWGSRAAPPAQRSHAHTVVVKPPAVHSPSHASRRLAHRILMDVCANAARGAVGAETETALDGQQAGLRERRERALRGSANRRHGRGGRDGVGRRLAGRERVAAAELWRRILAVAASDSGFAFARRPWPQARARIRISPARPACGSSFPWPDAHTAKTSVRARTGTYFGKVRRLTLRAYMRAIS